MTAVSKSADWSPLARTLTRRSFLGWSLATTAGLGAANMFLVAPKRDRVALTWMPSRGTLASVDDYPIWVAFERGYLKQLGVDLSIVAQREPSPGGAGADSAVTFVSPAELLSMADRGLNPTSIFQLCAGSVFGFALHRGGRVRRPRDLEGASIAIGDESWKAIVDPLLVEAGVNPRVVTLVVARDRWLEFAADGVTDAALSWRGLAHTDAGRHLTHFVGDRWSQLPAHSYAVVGLEHRTALEIDGLNRFLQALVLALEFAAENPRGAAQITYRSAPGLAETLSPQAAVDSLAVASSVYSSGRRRGMAWGLHERPRWQRYMSAAEQSGLAKPASKPVYSNQLIATANSIDTTLVHLDAATFALDRDFRHTTGLTGGIVDG
ncbi:MAG: ABC transporter substrate-binding protein [Chloroflexi bacterium]|nr:MAG: ABC transporter substrate-binding protein [Chloroflexota bacterium]